MAANATAAEREEWIARLTDGLPRPVQNIPHRHSFDSRRPHGPGINIPEGSRHSVDSQRAPARNESRGGRSLEQDLHRSSEGSGGSKSGRRGSSDLSGSTRSQRPRRSEEVAIDVENIESGPRRAHEEDDRSRITFDDDGLPNTAGQGGAFYDFLKDTVTNTISNIFPPNGQGEWPGAFDQREIRSLGEKMTEQFPEIVKDKRFNMKSLYSKAGKFIKGRRQRVINQLRKEAEKAGGDWGNIPKPYNLSKEDLKIALARAKDPEKKHSRRTESATKSNRTPSRLGSGGKKGFCYKFENLYRRPPTKDEVRMATTRGSAYLFDQLNQQGIHPFVNAGEAVHEMDEGLEHDATDEAARAEDVRAGVGGSRSRRPSRMVYSDDEHTESESEPLD